MYIRPRKLIDYLDIIWKRKGTLFLVMLVMLIATYVVIKQMPKVYQTKGSVVITRSDMPEELASGPSYDSVVSQLKSRNTLSDFVSRYRLYPKIKKSDEAIRQLDMAIEVEQQKSVADDRPISIKLAFKYTEPEICEKLINDLMGRFDDANRTISRMAAAEANRITDDIGKIQNRLKVVAPRNDLAMIETGIQNQINTQSQISASERRAVSGQITELRDREYRLRNQINELRRLVGEQDTIVKNQEGSVEYNNPAAAQLIIRRADLNAQLVNFRGQYTDRNPKVVYVQNQVDQINRELDSMKSAPKSAASGPSAASVDLRRMRQDLRQSEIDLEVTSMDVTRKDRQLMGMPMSGGISFGINSATLASLSPENRSEYERLIADLNALSVKREVMFRLGDIERSGAPMFKITERPIKPEVAIGPNRLFLMTISCGISLVLALFVVFALELPKLVLLNNDRDVEYFLGAPVLAYIPESVTPLERTRVRRLSWARGLLFLLLTPGLIFILVEVISRFGILGMFVR